MRCPSDPQAAVLACIQTHEQAGEYLLAGDGSGHRTALVVERTDHGPLHGVEMFVAIDESVSALVPAEHEFPLTASVAACVRHGWLTMDHEVTVTSQRFGRAWTMGPREYVLRQLDITEDGVIALGLWRERKLNAPPTATPTLRGRDLEIVALAEHAHRLGFRLAPREDQARADARRLAREGWVTRSYLGAGVRTLVPTALGSVEVAPDRADSALQPRQEDSL